MKTIVHMNEFIREKNPGHPVIRAVQGKNVAEANLFRIMYGKKEIGRIVFDPPKNPSDTHDVKGWLELYNGATVSL